MKDVLKCPVMSIEQTEQMCYYGNYGGIVPKRLPQEGSLFFAFLRTERQNGTLKEDEKKNES